MCLPVFAFTVHRIQSGLVGLSHQGDQHLKEDITRLIEELETSCKSPRHKTKKAQMKITRIGCFMVHRTSMEAHRTEHVESVLLHLGLGGTPDQSDAHRWYTGPEGLTVGNG
jgi:hypothetical protein